jgi:urea transport system ATP-binding protein
MAIVVVEQYLDFAGEIADHFVVMDRGEIVLAGGRSACERRAAVSDRVAGGNLGPQPEGEG